VVPGTTAGFAVVDITDPLHPLLVTRLEMPGDVIGLALSGTHVYVTESPSAQRPWRGLQVIDMADPAHPRIVGSLGGPGDPWGVGAAQPALGGLAVVGGYAYVATTEDAVPESQLRVIDVSNPGLPRLVGRAGFAGGAHGVAVSGGFAYVTGDNPGLRVIDIGDPQRPRLVASVQIPAYSWDVTVSGDVVDVANPANPRLVGTLTCPEPSGVAVSGSYVYCASSARRLDVVDVSVPESPRLVGSVDIPGYPRAVAVDGSHAYVSVSGIGLVVVDIASPENPRITASVSAGGFLATNGVDVSGGYVYLDCRGVGLLAIDVRDPEQPCIVGNVALPAEPIGVVLANGLVYIADSQGGLQIVLPQCEAAGPSVVTASLGPSPTPRLCVFPNPTTRQAAIRVTLPGGGRVAATIYDVSGRRVRSLGDELLSSGGHDLAWDGRDDHGREVAAGVHLARVSTPEGARTARIVIVR
jgi:hypothetical protein